MKKVLLKTGLVFLLISFQSNARSQHLVLNELDSYIQAREYQKALPILEKLSSQKNGASWKFELGKCYLNLKQFSKAENIISEVKDTLQPEFQLTKGMVQLYLGKYDDALCSFRRCDEGSINIKNSMVQNYMRSCLYALSNNQNNKWNIQYNQSFPKGLYTGGCYQASEGWFNIVTVNNKPKEHNKTYTLLTSNVDRRFTESTNLNDFIDYSYHMGGISFSQDSKANKTSNKNLAKNQISQNFTNTLNLYKAKFENGKLDSITPFSFNSREYSCIHPSLNQKGNICYFSSDMPGGYGGYDIYKIERKNGNWSNPINLGEIINSLGDEMYPYIFNDSILYFASDGLPGYGGADLFSYEVWNKNNRKPRNLGMPTNSSYDDFGINFVTPNSGYFFSNRNQVLNEDGFFSFEFPIEQKFDTAEGKVLDELTLQPLDDVTIIIIGRDSSVTYLKTDSTGEFTFNELVPNEAYSITAKKEHFQDKKIKVQTSGDGKVNIDLALEPEIALNSIFTLNNILFEYNDFRLTFDDMKILDRVSIVMLNNPKTKFEISAHTDSRGNDEDNLLLSQKRAQSTVYYLLSKGVLAEQLIAKGYGESRLKNECDNNTYCHELNHAINRRVEIKVISIK